MTLPSLFWLSAVSACQSNIATQHDCRALTEGTHSQGPGGSCPEEIRISSGELGQRGPFLEHTQTICLTVIEFIFASRH